MSKPVILCIDDQRDVLAALTKDLSAFTDYFELMDADSAEDAGEVLAELTRDGTQVALLICDHVMPGVSGVDFLSSLRKRNELTHTRKLLLTGLATQGDTIRAINEAAIDHYLAKPWQAGQLTDTVARLVTSFILEVFPDSYNTFLPIMHQDVMLDRMQQGFGPHGDR